jgi:cytochrome c oxidase subunit IV
MENVHAHASHGGGEKSSSTKAIWRTFWILLAITLVELVIGIFVAPHFHDKKIWFNILYLIFTAAKAFYIIAEFMHLGHEIKNLVMTIAVPSMLFIWFIAAFLIDGNSFNNLRNNYDPYYKEKNKEKVQKKEAHGTEKHEVEGKKPGGKE